MMGNISREKFEKQMGNILSSFPMENGSKRFEVAVINENRKQPFFGLYIYPMMDWLDDMTKKAVVEKKSFKELCRQWQSIGQWYIELDATCFDRQELNLNPKEIGALLLHEIGHTIYSDKPVERWYRSYQDARNRVKLADRASMKILYSLYSVPLAVSCMQKSWVDKHNRISVEYAADKTVMQYGYGDALLSAMNKITSAAGSITTDENAKDRMVENSINWANLNVSDLTKRKDRLKDELFYQSLNTSSSYMKANGIRLLNKLGFKMRERYSGYACEMTIRVFDDPEFMTKYTVAMEVSAITKWNNLLNQAKSEYEIATEGVFKKKKFGLPSQYDIDVIGIEIDKVTTHYDRVYCLDLIYKVFDDIEIFEDQIKYDEEKKSAYAGKIARYRQELDALRKRCLEKKIPEKRYQVFVKAPPGYEG